MLKSMLSNSNLVLDFSWFLSYYRVLDYLIGYHVVMQLLLLIMMTEINFKSYHNEQMTMIIVHCYLTPPLYSYEIF